MSRSDVLVTILVVLGIVGILWFFFYAVSTIVDDIIRWRRSARFRARLVLAIKNGQLSWEQVKIIAGASLVGKTDRRSVLHDVLSLSLTSGDQKLTPHTSLIEDYIRSDQRDEPFEDMPQGIRIHLERLRQQMPSRPELIEALVEHLRDARIQAAQQRKRQSIINSLSLIVGVLGFLIGVISLVR